MAEVQRRGRPVATWCPTKFRLIKQRRSEREIGDSDVPSKFPKFSGAEISLASKLAPLEATRTFIAPAGFLIRTQSGCFDRSELNLSVPRRRSARVRFALQCRAKMLSRRRLPSGEFAPHTSAKSLEEVWKARITFAPIALAEFSDSTAPPPPSPRVSREIRQKRKSSFRGEFVSSHVRDANCRRAPKSSIFFRAG